MLSWQQKKEDMVMGGMKFHERLRLEMVGPVLVDISREAKRKPTILD